MKIAFLDIETPYSLTAERGLGYILCACYKFFDFGEKANKMQVTRIDQAKDYGKRLDSGIFNLRDDTNCIMDIKSWFRRDNPDMLVTYNGKWFDLPYINTRLLAIEPNPDSAKKEDLAALGYFHHRDHYQTVRNSLRLRFRSMDACAQHLGIQEQKMRLPISVWADASMGSKDAMEQLVARCKSDVNILVEIHKRLEQLNRKVMWQY